MRRFVSTVLFAAAILALPVAGFAQEAMLTGTVATARAACCRVSPSGGAGGYRQPFEAVTDEPVTTGSRACRHYA